MKKTITKIILIAVVIISPWLLTAQKFNPNILKEITKTEHANALERQERIAQFLLTSNAEKTFDLSDGNIAVMYDVVDGIPQYKTTHNIEARQTTGVEFIQAETGMNLPLFGKGMTIGVWDGGLVLNNHQEFQNRIKNKLGSEYSNHATHVSGTIAASGVNPNAKGMLPEVTIHSYYAFNDDLGPMAQEASEGLILSNHSYGLILGWYFNGGWQWFGQSDGKDNRFGSYTSNSRSIDNITYNAPYYTIVWSAGNDRNDAGDGSRPPDGPFNIIGPAAAAKNIITVGAITGFEQYEGPESAVISGFSSWGPTNDGRIKPDLVADGVGLLSPGSAGPEAYSTLSGTSMSAPNVTGTLGLLQEFYRQSADTFMTAAQLKALAIHTVREAGSAPGPDYKFGWGVLNAIDAIKVLQGRNDKDTLFTTAELQNGDIHEFSLIPAANSKITATIVWTDVPGAVTENGSPTPNLVNDLDIYLIDDAGNKAFPWKMNPANFSQTAQKGDNTLDNVEKIEFMASSVRNYKLVVSHKGELVNNSQQYALTLTYKNAEVNEDLVYWVNGSGDFQTGQNFSLNSGGQSATVPFENLKTLVIDENSFSTDGTLTFSSDYDFDNIIFTGNESFTLDLGGNSITIQNAIHSSDAEKLKIKNGELIVKSNLRNEIFLNFDGSEALAVTLDMEGNQSIMTDINANQLNIINGSYNISNRSIALNGLNIMEQSGLEIKNSIINLSGLFFNYSNQVVLEGNEWFLEDAIFTSEQPLLMKDNFQTAGSNDLTGELTFINLFNAGNLNVFNQLEVDTLILDENSQIEINNSDLLIVNNEFLVEGSAAKSIKGSNASELGNLVFLFRNKLCIENLMIENIHFNSESILNVLGDGIVTNAENVLQLTCSELLFPDFKIGGFCANSLIQLEDLSDGTIDSYQWDFGNGTIFEGVNDVANPQIWFNEPGTYEVKLTISNENQTEEYIRTVVINENALSALTIIENQQGLVASTAVSEYQWYLNGIPLEGENKRILSGDLANGVYNVAYFSNSEDCGNRVSEPFEYFITSNRNQLDANIKLYPNPVNNILTVKGFENYNKFRIFDFQGKTIEKGNLNIQDKSLAYDVSHLKSGFYFFELQSNTNTIKLKFLIK